MEIKISKANVTDFQEIAKLEKIVWGGKPKNVTLADRGNRRV